jgi:hypothetical protein
MWALEVWRPSIARLWSRARRIPGEAAAPQSHAIRGLEMGQGRCRGPGREPPGRLRPPRSPSIANISHLLLELRRARVRVGEQRHVHAVRPHGRLGNSQHAVQRAGCLSRACRGRNAADSGIAHFEAMRPEYEVAALCGLRSTLACRPWRPDEVLDGRLAGRCPAPAYRTGTSRTSSDTVRPFTPGLRGAAVLRLHRPPQPMTPGGARPEPPSMAQWARICLPGRAGDPAFLRGVGVSEDEVRHG